MKGYQKKVIFLKNTGSALFEEAYFVVRCDGERRAFSHATMVREANRIIEENFGRKKRVRKILNISTFFAFLAGSLFSLVFCIILF